MKRVTDNIEVLSKLKFMIKYSMKYSCIGYGNYINEKAYSGAIDVLNSPMMLNYLINMIDTLKINDCKDICIRTDVSYANGVENLKKISEHESSCDNLTIITKFGRYKLSDHGIRLYTIVDNLYKLGESYIIIYASKHVASEYELNKYGKPKYSTDLVMIYTNAPNHVYDDCEDDE